MSLVKVKYKEGTLESQNIYLKSGEIRQVHCKRISNKKRRVKGALYAHFRSSLPKGASFFSTKDTAIYLKRQESRQGFQGHFALPRCRTCGNKSINGDKQIMIR